MLILQGRSYYLLFTMEETEAQTVKANSLNATSGRSGLLTKVGLTLKLMLQHSLFLSGKLGISFLQGNSSHVNSSLKMLIEKP